MEVLRSFSTPRRRWRAGEAFDPAALDGLLTVLELEKLGYVSGELAPHPFLPEPTGDAP